MLVLLQRWLLPSLLAGWLAGLPLSAQGPDMGAFAGSVRDEQGLPLASATVVIRGLDVNLERRVETDKDGRFYSGGFLPGRYGIILLRDQHVLWSSRVTLPRSQEVVRLEVNLKQLREAAEQVQRLDPELERAQQAEREKRAREERLKRHLIQGARFLRTDRPEQALEEYQAAREMEPDRGVLYALLGTAAEAAGRLDDAFGYYRHALELEPNEGAHHNNLGALLVRRGQLEEGLAHFQQAVQLDPGRAATYQFNRGAALLNAGRAEEALPAFQQAARSDPTLGVAQYFLGVVLLGTSPRRPAEAGAGRVEPRPGTLEAFQRYLELEPDGEYADRARQTLSELGVLPPALLLPEVPQGGVFD